MSRIGALRSSMRTRHVNGNLISILMAATARRGFCVSAFRQAQSGFGIAGLGVRPVDGSGQLNWKFVPPTGPLQPFHIQRARK